MLGLGAEQWELHHGPQCSDCTPEFGLRGRFFAAQWLRNLQDNTIAVRSLRILLSRDSVAGKVRGMNDHELIAHMARLLSDGFWHVHRASLRIGSGGSGAEGPVAAPAPSPSPQRVPERFKAPSVPVLEEEEGLPESADEAAIAAVLKNASEQGVPFCEECAKAAALRAQQGGANA